MPGREGNRSFSWRVNKFSPTPPPSEGDNEFVFVGGLYIFFLVVSRCVQGSCAEIGWKMIEC